MWKDRKLEHCVKQVTVLSDPQFNSGTERVDTEFMPYSYLTHGARGVRGAGMSWACLTCQMGHHNRFWPQKS